MSIHSRYGQGLCISLAHLITISIPGSGACTCQVVYVITDLARATMPTSDTQPQRSYASPAIGNST
jgi:hypothetical protein